MNGINKIQVTLLWKWIVKKKCFQLMTVCFLTLIFASCNMSSAGGPGPRTWIDTPLNGSNLPMEPLVVRSHAASEGGTLSAVLYVNGSQVSIDNVPDATAQLVEISQVWVPASAGDYDIYVVALDGAGNQGRSNSVRVHIGSEVVNPPPSEGGQPAEPPDSVITSSPAPLQNLPRQSDITSTPVQTCQVPTFTFSMNANCREGPGTAYEVDASFLQGQSAQIDGRNQNDPRWWWVLISGGDHCWVSGTTGSTSCLIADVPIITAPPLPVVIIPTDTSVPPPPQETAPAAPGNLSVTSHVCASPTYSVTLGWQDMGDNELGYRVYRNETLIATLGVNFASYSDIPPGSGPYTYRVEAFNNVGMASATTTDGGCIF